MAARRRGVNQVTRELGGSEVVGGFTFRVQHDFLTELRGNEGYKRYNEMRLNSPIIGALLAAIKLSVLSVDWFFSAEGVEDGQDDPRVVLLEEARDNMVHAWGQHISEALTCLPFGFAPFTINYERVGGRMLWRKFKLLQQDSIHRWVYGKDATGRFGMGTETEWTDLQQYPHIWPDPIPRNRILLYTINPEGENPEGWSMLRQAWIPYYFAKNLQQIEAIGFERGAAGLPMVELPEGADTSEGSEDMEQAELIVRNIRNDEQAGVVLPPGWIISLLSAAGGVKDIQMDVAIKRYESRMLMAALAQFLMLGQDKVGALSLSEDQTDFFNMSVNAIADMVSDAINAQAVPELLRLNGMDPTGVGLQHSPAGDVDMVEVADFLQKAGANITWMPEDEQWLRSLANLPDKTPAEIADAQEEKAQQAMERQQAIAATMQPGMNGDRPKMNGNEGLRDDNAAWLFAAGDAPDDEERRKHERRLQRAMNSYFKDLRKRVNDKLKE